MITRNQGATITPALKPPLTPLLPVLGCESTVMPLPPAEQLCAVTAGTGSFSLPQFQSPATASIVRTRSQLLSESRKCRFLSAPVVKSEGQKAGGDLSYNRNNPCSLPHSTQHYDPLHYAYLRLCSAKVTKISCFSNMMQLFSPLIPI